MTSIEASGKRRARLAMGIESGLLVLLLTCMSGMSAQDGWSPWQPIGNDVSVQFAQVQTHTWTWAFKNTGATTITDLKFKYTDVEGTHEDVVPLGLKPGNSFGGWAAYTAPSKPSIQIETIKRR